MEVQKILIRKNDREEYITWQILRDDHLPLTPANEFLKYLVNTAKSPNTVKSYAHHLKHFFNFIESRKLDWKEIQFTTLAEFVGYLKRPHLPVSDHKSANVLVFPQLAPDTLPKPRSNATINVMLAAVCSFYEYHARLENLPQLSIYQLTRPAGNARYKPFLHHLAPQTQVAKNKLKLKSEQKLPKTITAGEFKTLINCCAHQRDRFLLALLYETGMRIGQAIGLRHEDIRSYDNEIVIKQRENNVNLARTKSYQGYTVHVSADLMRMYIDYLLGECEAAESDYVFINLWSAPVGRPLSYPAVVDLFRRLSSKTGIVIRPHMLRHTHATEMIRATGRADLVSRRLGHKSIQTTLKIYTHLTDDDLKQAYQTYEKQKTESK